MLNAYTLIISESRSWSSHKIRQPIGLKKHLSNHFLHSLSNSTANFHNRAAQMPKKLLGEKQNKRQTKNNCWVAGEGGDALLFKVLSSPGWKLTMRTRSAALCLFIAANQINVCASLFSTNIFADFLHLSAHTYTHTHCLSLFLSACLFVMLSPFCQGCTSLKPC